MGMRIGTGRTSAKRTLRPTCATTCQATKRLPPLSVFGLSVFVGVIGTALNTSALASAEVGPGFSVDPIIESIDQTRIKRVKSSEKRARPARQPETATPVEAIQPVALSAVIPDTSSTQSREQVEAIADPVSQSDSPVSMPVTAFAVRPLTDFSVQPVAIDVAPAMPAAATTMPVAATKSPAEVEAMPASTLPPMTALSTGSDRDTAAKKAVEAGALADPGAQPSLIGDMPSGKGVAAPMPSAPIALAPMSSAPVPVVAQSPVPAPLPPAPAPVVAPAPISEPAPKNPSPTQVATVPAPIVAPATQGPPPPDATSLPPKLDMVGPTLVPAAGPGAAKPVPAIDRTPPDKAGDVLATPPNLGVESLPDAIVAALRENPDIQIALARQDDARYGIHQANAAYLPKLDVTVGVGPEFNRPETGDLTKLRRSEATASLNQTIWDFGVTINDIKRARADYRSAQWATRERIEAIAYDITSAYLNVLQSQKLVDLSEQEVAAHLKLLKMVTIQNELGLNTSADVSRAKSRLENIKSVQLDRESLLQQAREGYRRLTKRLPARAIDIPSAEPALPSSQDAAVDLIDKRSPRMAQAMEDRRSLDRQRASQSGAFFPRIGVQAQSNWKDDVQGSTGFNRDGRVMLTLSYSFSGGAEMAIRKRIGARLREADYEVDRRHREVEQDVRIDFTALDAARSKIATIDAEIDSAERVQKLYEQQFREGRRTVFDLLDSQQSLFAARANRLTNMTAKQLAEFRVLQKLGSLFELVSEGQPLPNLVVPAPTRPRK